MAWVNGDGIAMETAQTRQVMERLIQVGADFVADWTASERQILSSAVQLGNDAMGRAFRGNFDRGAEQAATIARVLADRVERRGKIGEADVQIYDAANALATQIMQDAAGAGQL